MKIFKPPASLIFTSFLLLASFIELTDAYASPEVDKKIKDLIATTDCAKIRTKKAELSIRMNTAIDSHLKSATDSRLKISAISHAKSATDSHFKATI